MSYSFEVTNYERQMKNYFKGISGKHIKDTLFINLRNNGSRGWNRYKGYFKCDINQSNYFFEETQIPQDVYPNGALELVLNFPRSEKNSNSGDCFCSIQLVYNDEVYNSQLLRFRKDYDLFGNNLVNEQKIEKEEEVDIYQKIEEQKKEEEKKKDEEKKKEIFYPNKIEEEIKKKNNDQKIEEKKDNENDIIVKKFRSAFDFSKADFSDEYILDIILKSDKDFQRAMMLHLDLEDKKMEEKKNKSKTSQGLDELVPEFRKAYQLSEQDYSNEQIKEVLAKKNGNFENAFEELMSFIQ
jgi:hypothetical protein